MVYVQIDAAIADALSEALYQLMLPPHRRGQNDVSRYYCDRIAHPSDNGWAVLVLPEEETVPVHLEADSTYLTQLLDMFVQNDAMSSEERDALVVSLTSLPGQSISILSFIPGSWAPYILDHAGAVSAGYIEQEE